MTILKGQNLDVIACAMCLLFSTKDIARELGWGCFSCTCVRDELVFCRSVSKVHDAWFADEDRVRKAVGLLEKPVALDPNAREARYS